MTKIVTSVTPQRFEKYQVFFPADWKVQYVELPYTDETMIKMCMDADFLFLNSTHPLTANVIRACSHLKLIHVEGVGFDKVDCKVARETGIPVCNNSAVNSGAVAEHTIGLMLAGLRRTAMADSQIKTIGFQACQQQFQIAGQHELSDMHIGLIGIGAIGKEVALRLKNWGCRISYYDLYNPTLEVQTELDIEYMELDKLLSNCDIISMHIPVLPSTYHMISYKQFKKMKPTALLVNTARGEVVDPMALADALENGNIYGAALDTLYPEPTPEYHPLLNLSTTASQKLIITPHIGGTTDEAFTRMLRNAITNMQRVLHGETPINIVN